MPPMMVVITPTGSRSPTLLLSEPFVLSAPRQRVLGASGFVILGFKGIGLSGFRGLVVLGFRRSGLREFRASGCLSKSYEAGSRRTAVKRKARPNSALKKSAVDVGGLDNTNDE